MTNTITSTAATAPAKKRGSKFTRGRARFHGRNKRGIARMMRAVEQLKGRKLTAKERGACCTLATPLVREFSSGR